MSPSKPAAPTRAEWADLFKRARAEDRTRAWHIIERLEPADAREVWRVLDWAGRAHRVRLYYAARRGPRVR